MKALKLISFYLLLGIVSSGCQTRERLAPSNGDERIQVRNNCCSLLYELLEQEKDVSKLRIIKSQRQEVTRLIKEISATAAAGAKGVESLAKRDSTLSLKSPDLPQGERATREAISRSQTKELLLSSGDDFELKLLLTQVEALNYGSHLAKVAAVNEPRTDSVQVLVRLEEEMRHLRERVIELLKSRRAGPSTEKASQ